FVKMLEDKQFRETEEIKAKAQISHAQPDDLIDFYHIKSRKVSQRSSDSLIYESISSFWKRRYMLLHDYVAIDVII
ncbi:hypothetical protein MKW92_017432, partial [Papaver armeniacum]